MITVTPDYNMFLNLLLIFYAISSFSKIGLGMAHSAKDTHWDLWDTADGILGICIIITVVFIL